MKKALLASTFLLLFLIARISTGQIVINEFVPANIEGHDNNGSFDDWIEIFNDGSSSVNLQGYGLTDDPTKPYLFRFPSYILDDDEFVIVFANDENNNLPVDHWETAVNASTTWRYFAGTSQPDTNWRNLSFNDGGWSTGNGGIGFGDGDDQKVISNSSISVMMRKTFTISDTSNILKAIFNIDYDDGFVAYLNGSEIARANLGVVGDRPNYNDLAISAHEAQMYQGDDPDSFYINPTYLKSLLRIGNNVLAVEVHNQTSTSNDLSAIPFLSFGMQNSGMTYSNPPSWFNSNDEEAFSAKFKLTRSGETIYLYHPNGNLVDQVTYTAMESDHSMGRKPDGDASWCVFKTPTPESSNNSTTCYSGYANPPVFSVAPGFYQNTQSITLTQNTPGGTIRYTTNGNIPTSSSPSYSSPISVSSSKTIRARVFASGYLPSPVVTNTYVINTTIKLPVFCITTDSLNLWDYNDGIYVLGPDAESNYPHKGANFWQDWRKPASVEYYDKAKNRVFNFECEFRIYGNYSRAKPQKSVEIYLKDQFGTGELNYSFLPEKPTIDKTDNIVLRNAGTDWNVVHFRDAFMERVMKPTHSGYLATEPAVMYLNGSYWGVFTIHENHDHHWIENNYGFKEDEIDYMVESGSSIEVKNGSDDFFWDSFNYATTQNANSANYYDNMAQYWDLDAYKDYFIAETYYNNGDWIGDWTNNIKHWRPLIPGGKLRYLLYDLDFGCAGSGSYNDNRLSIAINPPANCNSSKIFKAMLNNPQFKKEFINRYADLINTVFKPSSALGVMHSFQDSMSYDMTKHFAKWGSTMSNWQSKINSMTSFINNRPNKARDHIESQFNMNKQVTLTFNVNPAGAGRIQVSTVVPTSYPWTGVYFDGNPVTITAIPNPGYTFDRWSSNHVINNDNNQTTTYNFSSSSENITCYFSGTTQPAYITVSEFNYNSSAALDCGDWIELHNYGPAPLNISGWKLKDDDDNNFFEFPVGTTIPSNGYLVVANEMGAFEFSYPSVNNVIGPLGFSLGNGGDQIRLFDAGGNQYISFYYQDTSPWPLSADGDGFTCELTSNSANLNDGNSWIAGCIGGSPGTARTTGLVTSTHVSGNTTFCQGGQTILTINYSPGYTYQWQRNGIDIPSATDTLYIATLSGNYSTRVTSQGCSSISDTLIVDAVTTGQAPVVSAVTRCGEGVVTLTATAPDSIYWFDLPGGNIIGTGTTYTTPTLFTSTTFWAQTSLSCPSSPVPVNVTIEPIPSMPVVSDITRCGPGSVVINASSPVTVTWFNALTGGGQIFSGNTFITGYIPHDTTFFAEAGTACISERVVVNVTITSASPPVVSDQQRCGPGQLTFTASSLAPVFWYDSIVAGTQVGSGVNFITQTLTESQKYYAESNNGCASARVQVNANVYPVPAPPIGFDSSLCGPGSVPIYATSDVQVFWYDSPSGGVPLGSGSLFNTPAISNSTTYYAESEDICKSTRTAVLASIKSLAVAPSVSDANICGSGVAYLTAQANDPVYWFSDINGGSVLAIGGAYLTPVLNTTTTYYAVAIGNCASTPVAVTATVTPLPAVSLGNDTVIQSGGTILLDAGSGFDYYFWSTGATTRTIIANSTGNYSVEVGLNGCSGTDNITVTVVLGIQDISNFTSYINLFPNPVNDRLTIQVDSKKSINANFTINDITGKLLYSEDIKLNHGLNTQSIDMSSFAKGVYLFTIRSNEYFKTISIAVD